MGARDLAGLAVRIVHERALRGADAGMGPSGRRKVILVNISSLLALGSMLFYTLTYAVCGLSGMVRGILLELPFAVMFLAVPSINERGYPNLAKWTVCLGITAVVAVMVFGVQGSALGLHFYFVLFAVVPASLLASREKAAIAGLFLLNMGLFAYCEFVGVEPALSGYAAGPGLARGLRATFVLTSMGTVLLLAWLSERAAADIESRLARLALTDELTGLPNRRFFELTLGREIARAAREFTPSTLAMIDIDHFKQVNDRFGHDAGDEALKSVAGLLGYRLREADMVARVGGEEFVLLMPDTTLERGQASVRRIRDMVAAARVDLPGGSVNLTISAGLTEIRPGDDVDVAVKRADVALYQAKSGGRNMVVCN